ncbi:C-X-C motif chemokine 16 [Dasypus novemcinctus]|uniref:C-X-C motif chemokine 16 n=1 Tax=Dasypus novemcinctus TaxID=9361 RepID=UPI00265E3869|nr:C-X-C motif chemokine 16 [Dasypus novemcinctus]
MWWGRRPPSRTFLLLLPALLTLPGDGNEGSVAGSCPCDRLFPLRSPPEANYLRHFRKQLRGYNICSHYIRFQLRSKRVCGYSKEPWVLNLKDCFDRKECGHAHLESQAHRQHLPPPSTQVPEPTEQAPSDMGTFVQTYLSSTLQSSQQPTLPAGVPSLEKVLTFRKEATIPILGHNLASGPEAENPQQRAENVGPAAGSSAIVPVLSLLVIIFILTGILLYVLYKRRRERSLQYSPGKQAL